MIRWALGSLFSRIFSNELYERGSRRNYARRKTKKKTKKQTTFPQQRPKRVFAVLRFTVNLPVDHTVVRFFFFQNRIMTFESPCIRHVKCLWNHEKNVIKIERGLRVYTRI